MYIQDCYSDDLRDEVYQVLKGLGVKSSLKKQSSKSNLLSSSTKLFSTPLSYLDKQAVLLRYSGASAYVPSFIVYLCNHLRSNLAVDGIFRKGGNASRQKEIRARLESGGTLNADDHVIDVANILKSFLRNLPEPLIPYHLHETLLKCLLLKGRESETVLLACLLLPAEHMDCLTYLIEFLNEVASLKESNRMGPENLAIVFSPNIMPIKTRRSQAALTQNTPTHTKIVRILLDNVGLLGSVPVSICEKLSIDQNNPRKRRSSGSLNKMFSGFKKIVGRVSSSTSDTNLNTKCSVPRTPANGNTTVPVLSAKRRKVDNSTPFSMKKRREVLRCLPEEMLLPKSPMVSKCFSSRLSVVETRSASNEVLDDDELVLRDCPSTSNSMEFLAACGGNPQFIGGVRNFRASEPQSAFSKLCHFSRRKRKSGKLNKSSSFPALTPDKPVESNLMTTPRRLALSQNNCYAQYPEEDLILVPGKEYKELQSRVSDIESLISAEFTAGAPLSDTIGVSLSDSDGSQTDLTSSSKVDKVQSQYQKTLRETGRLSDTTTDTIAQHLSRELKIRSSAGGRVMRSPSQRKIGSIRRRSQERVPRTQLSRHLSLNLHKTKSSQLYRSRSLQRGRPNSFSAGLQPVFVSNVKLTRSNSKKSETETKPQPLMVKNAAVVKTRFANSLSSVVASTSDAPPEVWKSAEAFLAGSLEKKSHLFIPDKRESIRRIRAQNAGMVMEKAKLFSNIGDYKGAPQPKAQSVGNFVTCIKLNSADNNVQVNGKNMNIDHKESLTMESHFPGKENVDLNAKGTHVSTGACKTPVSSFLHRNYHQANTSSGRRKQVMRAQSERTPHKTVITIGTPRRSPRLSELNKY